MNENNKRPKDQEQDRQQPTNFNAREQGGEDPMDEALKLHLTDNSTLQTREEKESDNTVDVRQDNDISVSEDDLHDPNAGRLTGRETGEEQDNNQ